MPELDGRKLAKELRDQAEKGAEKFASRWGRAPSLHVIMVGDDPASRIYVRNKGKACKGAGIDSQEHLLPADTASGELIDLIQRLNADDRVDGILVQLPLPRHLDSDSVIQAIDFCKDVDGLHPINLGNLLSGRSGLFPCTPLGCMRLIDRTGIDLAGSNAVVVGRSNLVGKPISIMLLKRHATVTMCHSKTRNLARVLADADLVVAAAGRPGLIRGEWIKKGAVVIDVGINRAEDGSLRGDVDFESAASRASWITPVPGGVGPMTVAFLLSNTIEAATMRKGGKVGSSQ